MLPQIPYRGKDFHIAWLLEPSSQLAGDMLNIIPLGKNRIGLYVMDVSGHGVPASLLSVTMHHALSSNPVHSCLYVRENGNDSSPHPARPSEVLEQLNARFPFDPEQKQFVTILFGIYDTTDRIFRYASAGHCPPILLPKNGATEIYPSAGFPIGFVPEPRYEEHEIRLNPGDRFFLFSDGMVEPFNAVEVEFGMDRFVKTLSENRLFPLEKTLSSTLVSVRKWAKDSVLEDDATILGLEVL
jgi:sigma-B regulation protein RsbU (phosphoserine phosphatase)